MQGTPGITPLEARDLAEWARILSDSFGTDPARVRTGLGSARHARVYVLRVEGRIVGTGTLRACRAGHAGGLVRAVVLSNVAVAPAARGRGCGRRLVEGLLLEITRLGIDVTLLVPRSEAFWARFGFVRGGVRHVADVELDRLDPHRATFEVRPLARADLPGCTRLARAMARTREGWVAIGTEERVRRLRAPRRAFVLEREGRLGAAATVSHDLGAAAGPLLVHELLAADAAAAAGMWAQLARFAAPGGTARWRAAPDDPFALALGGAARFRERGTWMLRVAGSTAGDPASSRELAGRFALLPLSPCT